MPRTREPLREKILAAAAELLRERGAAGLSQPQVARRAGIPQGHLTYYFPRKADLLAAVARRFREEMAGRLAVVGERLRAGAGRRAAAELVASLVLDIGRTRSLLGLLAASEEDEALRRSLLETLAEGRPAVAGLLGHEVDDPVVDLVLALSWGLEVQQLIHRRPPRAVRRLAEALLDWLERARPAPARTQAKTRGRRAAKGGTR